MNYPRKSNKFKSVSIVYPFKGNLYLNITNRCTMRCKYCIKHKWKWNFRGYNLRLNHEPSAEEVMEAIEKFKDKNFNEVVFCGYGEPLMRLDIIKKVSKLLKQKKYIVRINTNGHGNLIYKKNICPELKGIIDKISISLNGHNADLYYQLHKPKYGKKTFYKVIDFIKECKKYIPHVTITTVEHPDIDIEECRKIAQKLKVDFIVRPYL